jgi:protein-S-isoprenylcysteine O-methyltransferase Ste14
MANVKRDYSIYLAALTTVSQMLLTEVYRVRLWETTRYLALLVGVFGFGLVCAAMLTLQRHGKQKPGGTYMQARRVVDRGPFAVVRHPQYLGYICLNLTFMILSQHWLIIVLGCSAVALFYRSALREEDLLLEKFGADYRAYGLRVPRFNIVQGLARALDRRQSY